MPRPSQVFWKRSSLIGGCISLVVLLVYQSGGADVRSFWTAVDNAQASNPQIHKAEALLRATLEENPKTLAKLLPLVNLRAGKNVYDDTHYVNLGVNSHNLSSVVELSLRQPLYNRHDALGHNQSDAVVRAALADMEDARQQVAMSVATVAANWLEAKEVLDLGEKYRKVTKRHRDVNRTRQKAGESTATDVQTSASRAEQAEAAYVQSLNTLEKAAIAFREVVGANPSPDMTLPELSWRETVDWEEPEKMQEQLQKWIENRPDLQAAMARLEAAQTAVKIERASHYPTVDLDYRASRTWDSELGGSSGVSIKDTVDAQTLLVSLNVPLFSGGETSARVREARSRKENTLANLQALRNQAMRDVNQARMDIKNQQVAIIWLTKALQSSERALAGMEEEFQAGTRTLLELLDVQYEVLTLNTNLVRNRFQEQLARVRLWQALGVPLRPESPTSFVALLESARLKEQDSRGNKPVVLASMDLPTRAGKTLLQAIGLAAPEGATTTDTPARPAKDRQDATPDARPLTSNTPGPSPGQPAAAPSTAPGADDTPAAIPGKAGVKATGTEETGRASARGQAKGSAATTPGKGSGTETPTGGGSDLTESLLLDTVNQLTANLRKIQAAGSREQPLERPEGAKTVTATNGTATTTTEAKSTTTDPTSSLTRPTTSGAPGQVAAAVTGSQMEGSDPATGLDTLLEVYTTAILTEKPIPERMHRQVAGILRQYLPAMAAADVDPKSIENTAIAAPLPQANPAKGDYAASRPLLRGGPYLVHLGAFRNERECQRLAADLAADNIPSWMDAVRTPDGNKIVRLLVGPFASYYDVLQVTKALSAQSGLVVGWVKNPNWREWQKP
ncbi:MAG: TolC family protein [Magnetococcales bacterium]|nr:TolC family protein [Magnetococcales bacterium]